MSEIPSGSTNKPKAISSLAKRPSDPTRQGGTQKLKFIPTLPPKKTKDAVKSEPKPDTISVSSNDRGRGRGRGRGEGAGGRGRGVPRPPVEMVASGPFALGPAMAGTSSSRRFTPAATPIATPTKSGSSSLGSGLSQSAAPKIKIEERRKTLEKEDEDEEVYSDPDEGVEIVDMEKVRDMDWMAPDSVRKERFTKKPKKEDPDVEAAGEINLANALNLSESEDEEELDAMIDDFGKVDEDYDMNIGDGAHRLYFFQFPDPFPTLTANPSAVIPKDTSAAKKVTFAPDIKSEVEVQPSSSHDSGAAEIKEELDGIIGDLEIYRSGAIKIRLANGILLDVNAATQASFLQQAVHLDLKESRMAVLGEISKRFVVTPDVDTLLSAMDAAESAPRVIEGEENMISMDVT